MSTSPGVYGLAFWIPELLAALDEDPAGAGAQLRSTIAGRSARIGLDDDVVLVESIGEGSLTVRSDDTAAQPDGSGFTTRAVVVALLDSRVDINQVIISGDLELRSAIDDALWMYRIIELLLDGSSRVPRLRELSQQFLAAARVSPPRDFVDWRSGSRHVEIDLLGRLGLLVDQKVDRDG
jgi:hypothetical protein